MIVILTSSHLLRQLLLHIIITFTFTFSHLFLFTMTGTFCTVYPHYIAFRRALIVGRPVALLDP